MGTCSGYLNFMIKRRNVAQPIRKIVKGFGMLPNKVLQNLGITGIFKKARVGTAVPCLPSMFSYPGKQGKTLKSERRHYDNYLHFLRPTSPCAVR